MKWPFMHFKLIYPGIGIKTHTQHSLHWQGYSGLALHKSRPDRTHTGQTHGGHTGTHRSTLGVSKAKATSKWSVDCRGFKLQGLVPQ